MQSSELGQSDMPIYWSNILFFVGIAKAAVAGVGLALAILGALDIATAAAAADWLDKLQDEYFGAYATLGGVVGAAWKIIFK